MFDIGWGELLLIGIVALVVIGPKELPGVMRTVGQWVTKIRRMAGDFQNQFQEAMREAELADLKKEVDDMAEKAANYANFDPISDMRKELESTQRELESTGQQIHSAVTNPGGGAPEPPAAPAEVAGVRADPVAAEAEPAQLASPSEAAAPMPDLANEPIKEPLKSDAGGKPA
jgi:sec-independent protein translocase protein TatB